MHNIDNDFVPLNLKNLFTRLASIHSRAAAAAKFHVIHSRTKQQNQSFSSLRARIWNKIREFLQSQPKQSFKKHLQNELLQFLVHHEGVSVDVYDLAVKLFLNLIYIVIYKFVLHYKLRLFVFFSMHWCINSFLLYIMILSSPCVLIFGQKCICVYVFPWFIILCSIYLNSTPLRLACYFTEFNCVSTFVPIKEACVFRVYF